MKVTEEDYKAALEQVIMILTAAVGADAEIELHFKNGHFDIRVIVHEGKEND